MFVVSVEAKLEETVGGIATPTAYIEPHVSLLQAAFPSYLEIDRGLVHEDHPTLKDPDPHGIVDGGQSRAQGKDPFRQGLATDLDVGAAEDLHQAARAAGVDFRPRSCKPDHWWLGRGSVNPSERPGAPTLGLSLAVTASLSSTLHIGPRQLPLHR